MKKLKYISILTLIMFSFFLTDRIILYTENRNPLMKEIKEKSSSYQITFVNAIVEDNSVIPGINGREVSLRKSYIKMSEFGSFNENFLWFDEIKPDISKDDHLDKVIVSGNPVKRRVAFILEPSDNNESYFESKQIPYAIIANLKTDFNSRREYINGEVGVEKAGDLSFLLNRRKLNPRICLVGYSNIEYCQKRKYYLVSNSIDTNNNITESITKIRSGDIILIRKNANLSNINLLLNEIKRQDLTPTLLSRLISETN